MGNHWACQPISNEKNWGRQVKLISPFSDHLFCSDIWQTWEIYKTTWAAWITEEKGRMWLLIRSRFRFWDKLSLAIQQFCLKLITSVLVYRQNLSWTWAFIGIGVWPIPWGTPLTLQPSSKHSPSRGTPRYLSSWQTRGCPCSSANKAFKPWT